MVKFYLDESNNRVWYYQKTVFIESKNTDGAFYDRYCSLDGEVKDVLPGELDYDTVLPKNLAYNWLTSYLNKFFKPVDNGTGYIDPTLGGKYHYTDGNYFGIGGNVVAGNETDRRKAVKSEVDFVFSSLTCPVKVPESSFVKDLLKSNFSVKKFRGMLLEDSSNFEPGSAADMVFKFYKELRRYYSDLLIYQFQMYSDRPKTSLNLSDIEVCLLRDDVRHFSFSHGDATDLSVLQELNGYPFSDVSSLTFKFVLSPEFKYLDSHAFNNINKDLFTKIRSISVLKGDGTFIKGVFKPTWNDAGLTLTCNGVSHDIDTSAKMFMLSGGI